MPMPNFTSIHKPCYKRSRERTNFERPTLWHRAAYAMKRLDGGSSERSGDEHICTRHCEGICWPARVEYGFWRRNKAKANNESLRERHRLQFELQKREEKEKAKREKAEKKMKDEMAKEDAREYKEWGRFYKKHVESTQKAKANRLEEYKAKLAQQLNRKAATAEETASLALILKETRKRYGPDLTLERIQQTQKYLSNKWKAEDKERARAQRECDAIEATRAHFSKPPGKHQKVAPPPPSQKKKKKKKKKSSFFGKLLSCCDKKDKEVVKNPNAKGLSDDYQRALASKPSRIGFPFSRIKQEKPAPPPASVKSSSSFSFSFREGLRLRRKSSSRESRRLEIHKSSDSGRGGFIAKKEDSLFWSRFFGSPLVEQKKYAYDGHGDDSRRLRNRTI